MPKKHLEYNKLVLEHYRNPRNSGKLKHATHEAEVLNELCGDEISVSLTIENSTIKDIGFTSRGCALMTASASLLSEALKEKKVSKLKNINIEKLLGIKISKTRAQCVKLPIKALNAALK